MSKSHRFHVAEVVEGEDRAVVVVHAYHLSRSLDHRAADLFETESSFPLPLDPTPDQVVRLHDRATVLIPHDPQDDNEQDQIIAVLERAYGEGAQVTCVADADMLVSTTMLSLLPEQEEALRRYADRLGLVNLEAALDRLLEEHCP